MENRISKHEKNVYKKMINFLNHNKWLILIFFFHIILVNNFFPINKVFDSKLIINDDYPTTLYKSILMKLTLSEGKTEAYIPYFYAGYPLTDSEGFRNFLGEDKLPVLLFLLFPFFSTIHIFKFYIFAIILIFPFFVYLAARNFNLTKKESLIALLLTIIIWQFNEFFHMRFYTGGEINFVLVSCLSILAISFFYRYLVENKIKYLFLFLILSFIVLTMHIFSAIILVIPFLVLCFFLYRNKPHQTVLIILILSIPFLILAPFFLKLLNGYLTYYRNPLSTFQTQGIKSFVEDIQNDILYLTTIFLGFFGIYLLKKENFKIKFILFLLSSIFYFVYAYFGSLSYITSITYPERFLIPLNFFLIISSSKAINKLHETAKKNKKYLLILIILILIFLPLKVPDMYNKITSQMKEQLNYKITTDVPKDVDDLIFWIRENTSSDGRILIEDSGYKSEHIYGGGHISYFPFYTGREFIGGPYPYASVVLGFWDTNFYEGILFNIKNVSNYSSEELNYYFNLYNIKWIISWSDESRRTFDKYAQYIFKVTKIGNFSIYETGIKPTFFIKGSGEINASFNSIEISNASRDEIIIKYRYMNGLKTEPELKIREYKLENFSRGFISILNNDVSSLRIYI